MPQKFINKRPQSYVRAFRQNFLVLLTLEVVEYLKPRLKNLEGVQLDCFYSLDTLQQVEQLNLNIIQPHSEQTKRQI